MNIGDHADSIDAKMNDIVKLLKFDTVAGLASKFEAVGKTVFERVAESGAKVDGHLGDLTDELKALRDAVEVSLSSLTSGSPVPEGSSLRPGNSGKLEEIVDKIDGLEQRLGEFGDNLLSLMDKIEIIEQKFTAGAIVNHSDKSNGEENNEEESSSSEEESEEESSSSEEVEYEEKNEEKSSEKEDTNEESSEEENGEEEEKEEKDSEEEENKEESVEGSKKEDDNEEGGEEGKKEEESKIENSDENMGEPNGSGPNEELMKKIRNLKEKLNVSKENSES
jgi:hypothetical protein